MNISQPKLRSDKSGNNKFCYVTIQNIKDVFTLNLGNLHRKIIKVSKGHKCLNGCFHSELKKLRLTIVSVQVVASQLAQKKRGGGSQNNQGRLASYSFRRLLACQACRMERTSWYNEWAWTCGGAPWRLCYVCPQTSSNNFWILPV